MPGDSAQHWGFLGVTMSTSRIFDGHRNAILSLS